MTFCHILLLVLLSTFGVFPVFRRPTMNNIYMHTDIDIIHCSDACVYIQYPVEQHQKPPWRDLVFGFMWGTPRESKTSTRESRAKAPRKGCVKVESRKQWRKQVDSRSTFEYSCAPSFTGNFPRKQPRKILRNTCRRERQNCARERTAKAVAKASKD